MFRILTARKQTSQRRPCSHLDSPAPTAHHQATPRGDFAPLPGIQCRGGSGRTTADPVYCSAGEVARILPPAALPGNWIQCKNAACSNCNNPGTSHASMERRPQAGVHPMHRPLRPTFVAVSQFFLRTPTSSPVCTVGVQGLLPRAPSYRYSFALMSQSLESFE